MSGRQFALFRGGVVRRVRQLGDIMRAAQREIDSYVYPTVDAAIAAFGPSREGT